MIPTIGIVGGIGSGKSAVADAMRQLGGHLIAADQLGHEALRQPDIKAQLVERWGTRILDDAGRRRSPQGRPNRVRRCGRVARSGISGFSVHRETNSARNRRARAMPDVKFIVLDAAICSRPAGIGTATRSSMSMLRARCVWLGVKKNEAGTSRNSTGARKCKCSLMRKDAGPMLSSSTMACWKKFCRKCKMPYCGGK